MATEAQRAASKRYYERTKDKSRVYMFRMNKERDADIIAILDSKADKTAYIRKLIRKEASE